MRALDFPAEAVEAFRRRYRHLPAVREAEVHELLRRKQYCPAINLLKESKRLDSGDMELVAAHSARLIRLYQRLGRREDCREELLFNAFTCPQEGPAHIQELKALTPENDWASLRETLLAAPAVSARQKELLAEETDQPGHQAGSGDER